MRTIRFWSGAAMAAATLAAASLQAQEVNLAATLTTSQEPSVNLTTGPANDGAPRPVPNGFATFTLNAAQTQLAMSVTIFGIDVTGTQSAITNDNLLNAHIHCCAALAVPPATAGVRWGFFGSPDNDITPKQLVVTPFVGSLGGTFTSVWDLPEGNAGTTLATNLPGILAGQSYINFHTVQNPGGEIRGQIAVVPEPSTYALMATGLAGVALSAWRRRRA
jgi:hypothetical protein